MDKFEPKSPEYYAEQKLRRLQEIKEHWDNACERLNIKIDEWQPQEVLEEVAAAFASRDEEAELQGAEKLRELVAFHLFQRALSEKNHDLQSSNSYPGGGMDVRKGDIDGKKYATLYFFSGTRGERIIVTPKELRLPYDEVVHKTNLLLREVLKQLFPQAQGEEEHDLTVPYSVDAS